MSGFSKNRFVVTSEQELDEFICGICHEVLNNPVSTHCCKSTYCWNCINQWLIKHNTCPRDGQGLAPNQLMPATIAYMSLLNKLIIKCDFHSIGCEVTVKLSELKLHLQKCEFNPNKPLNTISAEMTKAMEDIANEFGSDIFTEAADFNQIAITLSNIFAEKYGIGWKCMFISGHQIKGQFGFESEREGGDYRNSGNYFSFNLGSIDVLLFNSK